MVRIHQPKPRQAKLKIENSKLKICWRILIYALILNSQLSILNSCASPSHKQFNPAKVDFSVAVNPFLDNQLYPSLILALDQSKPSILNTDLSTLTCTVTSPANNAVLRIVVDSSVFNYVSILQEIMPHRGETYTFAPVIKWKYDRLRNLRNPVPLDLTLTCYINDEEVDTKTIHLTARSVNECPLSLSHKGAILDTRWLFAAYVNEDHPDIEQILTDILSQGNITRLTGYQTGKSAAVDDQVFAVWYYALDHGISYSSITCTSNPSPTSNVQHIRFFDQVYKSRQANCVDACVFFASILRKIGLRPVIFVEPCHAYLGYYTDRRKTNVNLLETTITSWVNFPRLSQALDADGKLPQEEFEKISKYLSEKQIADYQDGRISFDQLKRLVARSLFDKAQEYDRETYEQNRQNFADTTVIPYQSLDIEKLRNLIQPIN